MMENSGAREGLSRIAVRIAPAGGAVPGAPPAAAAPAPYHGRRRAVQVLALALIVLVPICGLLRFDVRTSAFVVLDRQVWLADFFLISGLWIFLATMLVFLYSIAGTVFCGWVCPQNTVSEWANGMMRALLGRRAEVSLGGEAPRVTASRNTPLRWAALGIAFLAASMLIALVPMLYFFPPGAVLSFAILREDPRLADSLYWIYTVNTLIVLLDVTVLRHFWCRFICIYRVWQHSFRTRQTLHVAYDASRSADCSGCNFCTVRCFLDLDPRHTEVYSSCINCGECIDACDTMHRKTGEAGLLRFAFGERAGRAAGPRNNETSLLGRARWALPFAVLGLSLLAWGVWSYEPLHLSVDHGTGSPGAAITEYRINVANKLYRDQQVEVRIHGVASQEYRLSADALRLGPVEHGEVLLRLSSSLPRGLHRIEVDVRSPGGWSRVFPIQHLAD
jgi:polyferredoxin